MADWKETTGDMRTGGRLLSAQELADYLDVPLATIYAWRHRDCGPPGFRVGKHLRFRWGDVEEWIRQQVRASQPEAIGSHSVNGDHRRRP